MPFAVSCVGLGDLLQDQPFHDRQPHPERAVTGEDKRAEGVVLLELPHPGQDLHDPAVHQRHRQDDVGQTWSVDHPRVEQAQDEGRQREGGQSQRARVGDRISRRAGGHHQFRWGRWPLLGQFDPQLVCLILRYSFRRHVALLGVKNWRPAEPALRAARLDRSPVARCGGSLCPLRRPFTARRTPVGLTQTTHPCGFVESARVRPCAPRSSGRRQQYQQQATFPRGPGTIPRSGSPEAGRPRGEQAPARRAYRPLWRCPAGRRVQIRVRVGAPTRSVRTVGQVGHPAPLAGEPG